MMGSVEGYLSICNEDLCWFTGKSKNVFGKFGTSGNIPR